MVSPQLVYTIDAPHFNAGVIVLDNKVIHAAPIVNYMIGWDIEKVQYYCKIKGWSLELEYSRP